MSLLTESVVGFLFFSSSTYCKKIVHRFSLICAAWGLRNRWRKMPCKEEMNIWLMFFQIWYLLVIPHYVFPFFYGHFLGIIAFSLVSETYIYFSKSIMIMMMRLRKMTTSSALGSMAMTVYGVVRWKKNENSKKFGWRLYTNTYNLVCCLSRCYININIPEKMLLCLSFNYVSLVYIDVFDFHYHSK